KRDTKNRPGKGGAGTAARAGRRAPPCQPRASCRRARSSARAPAWFFYGPSRPNQSRRVIVEDCPIHYLFWSVEPETSIDPSLLLFVHGCGTDINWWSFIAPYLARYFLVAGAPPQSIRGLMPRWPGRASDRRASGTASSRSPKRRSAGSRR